MSKDHHKEIPVSAAVITVSTTRTKENDTSGRTICEQFNNADIAVVYYRIIPDQDRAIHTALHEALGRADCIVFNGGTGLTPDDRTIEVVAPELEKIIDGFGELFRQKSYAEIGTAAILSRALAGTVNGKAIFCIPGSTRAVRLAVEEIIIPEIRHILTHARAV